MLGRLRMSIDECEEAYVQLSKEIFTPRRANANILGQIYDYLQANGKFVAQPLEDNIKKTIRDAGLPEDEKFEDKKADSCKVYAFECFVERKNMRLY